MIIATHFLKAASTIRDLAWKSIGGHSKLNDIALKLVVLWPRSLHISTDQVALVSHLLPPLLGLHLDQRSSIHICHNRRRSLIEIHLHLCFKGPSVSSSKPRPVLKEAFYTQWPQRDKINTLSLTTGRIYLQSVHNLHLNPQALTFSDL